MSKLVWLVGIAGALILTACASSGHRGSSSAPAGGSGAPASSASPSPSEASSTSGGAAKVSVGTTAKGKVLAGPTGHALYIYDADTATKSTCTDQCAAAWPPLVGTPAAGAGVDDSDLGTITRPDGAKQVTYDGHPLYYFGKDEDTEDVYGDGVAGIWHVAKADQAASASSSSDDNGGY